MELLNTLRSFINIDTILTDPMLLTAAVLVIGGPLLFVLSLWRYTRAVPQVLPPDFPRNEPPLPQETPAPLIESPVATAPVDEPAPVPLKHAPHISDLIQEPANAIQPGTPAAAEPPPSIIPEPPAPIKERAEEKTVVMPSGMGEIQGQMEIAFSQIKNLNKKIYEMEALVESLARQNASKLDVNEIKEPPTNAAEFAQKLLKLAEHVIVLEKEMARLKSSSDVKPPVMPL